MITVGQTICMHPFSQVVKKMSDPEGDQLAFKVSARFAWRYLPPFPLLASLADAEYAAYSLLPQEAREAQDLAEQGDVVAALDLLEKALAHSPENVCLHSVAIQVAFQGEAWQRVEDWSLAALGLCPDHPVLSHNLAVLYSWQEDLLPKAVGLLETALEQAPSYGRAHLTLASCYAQTGEMDKANEHFDWVKEHDQELAPEAELILAEMQNGTGE